MKQILLISLQAVLLTLPLHGQDRWTIQSDGSIKWNVVKGETHTDNIEMSGRFISTIITYGVDDKGRLVINRQLVFPMLRTIPNDTHASFTYSFGTESSPQIKINNRLAAETVSSFSLKGILTIESLAAGNVNIKREITPSTDKPVMVEKYTLVNKGSRDVSVEVEDFDKNSRSQPGKSFYGVYEISANVIGSGVYTLKPDESLSFSMVFSGRRITEPKPLADPDVEIAKRTAFTELVFRNLQFVSPDTVLNHMFAFAKIRAMESIFETKGGLVHSPGGGAYYAAIWANDQAEYANPFFAYTGYETAIEAGMNSWRWFARYMNPDYKPIPSSIIAEGTDFWNGAGDRGDMAMIAYGASRFALALGDKKKAEELWPLIEWCIEYCRRKLTPDGVVASDSDELEGRFPAGKANLCTSSLYYDALTSASYLARDLGKPASLQRKYLKMAGNINISIENYFGSEVEGFDTYRYYDGNNILRSWICIPLTMGIFDRAEGTVDALFSSRLWTEQGLLTQAGTTTFWDRSTLYGFRGVFAAGAVDRGMQYFRFYSRKRLLGDHVPYAVEAWPEGNQRHLSAESSLYCRAVTEGLFGFRPAGLNSFQLTPRLPSGWNSMALRNVIAFDGKKIDIEVARNNERISVSVLVNGKLARKVDIMQGRIINIKL
jgi:hypothetical protein